MAVRAMGLQDETEKEHSIDVSRYDLPVSWNAAGYVKVALLRGLLMPIIFPRTAMPAGPG